MRYLLRGLLALVDLACLCLAFALGWYTRFRLLPLVVPGLVHVEQPWSLYVELILPGMALLLIFASREKLYRLGPEGSRRQVYGSLQSVGWLAVVFLAYLVLFQRHYEFSRLGTMFALGYLAVLLPMVRVIMMKWIEGLSVLRIPTLIIGAPGRVESFLEMAGREQYLRSHLLLGQMEAHELLDEDGNDFLPGADKRVDELFANGKLEKVIIFMEELPRKRLTTLLRKFEIRARNIKLVPDGATMALMGARILRHDSQPLLALEQRLWNPAYRLIKRSIDVAAGLIALPLVLLLVALCAPFLGVRPLMRVRRFDLSGKPFNLLQLRIDYERGGFLFQTGLYKLPELLNVLSGRQSLVGPAPLIEREFELYAGLAESFRVIRPGMTGLWQVSDYGYFDPGRRLGMDMYYTMNWSPTMELRILLESAFKAFWSLHRPRTGAMRS